MKRADHIFLSTFLPMVGLVSLACSVANKSFSGVSSVRESKSNATDTSIGSTPQGGTAAHPEPADEPVWVNGSYLTCDYDPTFSRQGDETRLSCSIQNYEDNLRPNGWIWQVIDEQKLDSSHQANVAATGIDATIEIPISLVTKLELAVHHADWMKSSPPISASLVEAVSRSNDQESSDQTRTVAKTCLELQQAGKKIDGIYLIYPDSRGFAVYCDMTTDGGGWTLLASSALDSSSGLSNSVESHTDPTSGAILTQSSIVAIANISTSVRINDRDGVNSVISTDSYPIQRICKFLNLNDNANKGNPGLHWTGNAVNQLVYSADVSDTALNITIYQANWNDYGLHWWTVNADANWFWGRGNKNIINMRLWVR